jgi:hypothetical protein
MTNSILGGTVKPKGVKKKVVIPGTTRRTFVTDYDA